MQKTEFANFLDTKLGHFVVVTALSTWDNVDENAEREAIRIYREISPFLLQSEAAELTEAWSQRRRNVDGASDRMLKAVESVNKRVTKTNRTQR